MPSSPSPAHSLATELRSLIEAVRTADLENVDGVDALAADVARITEQITPHVVDGPRMQAGLTLDVHGERTFATDKMRATSPAELFPYSPVIGGLNPIAPPLDFWADGEQMRGRARFGSAYNGPPTGVHGGWVAAALDELLGSTAVLAGLGGFTGTLTVRYESLTPLDTDLELHAWVDKVDGRKTTVVGEIRNGATRCAIGTGIFIRPES